MSNSKSITKVITIKGSKVSFENLENALKLIGLEIAKTDEVATTTATPKAKKTEYALPYTVDGCKVTIGNEDGSYLNSKVFNAVKYCIKQNGGAWDKDNKVWKFKSKKAVETFEKAWKDGKK